MARASSTGSNDTAGGGPAVNPCGTHAAAAVAKAANERLLRTWRPERVGMARPDATVECAHSAPSAWVQGDHRAKLPLTPISVPWVSRPRRQSQPESSMRWHIDHLTGLHNREAFARRLRHAGSLKVSGTVALLDIDHFKTLNDRHGHQRGDEALRVVARRLSESLPHDAVLARIGGDEFMVFLPEVDTGAAESLMRRCLDHVKEPLERADDMAPPTMSGGLTAFDDHGIDDVFEACDIAMDAAKSQGRD